MKLNFVPLNSQTEAPASAFRTLWDQLHSRVATIEQFEAWAKRVPCGVCRAWLKAYLRDNPPTANLREFGWNLHNKVNEKLRGEGKDRPHFSWEQFEEKYPR